MVEYPPYVDCYGKIAELFKKIREATVPPKVTYDFLSSKLDLKSTTHRAFIPLLKKLGFIDDARVPTTSYREYRDDSKSKLIMAKAIKHAYSELYSTNEYAHTLSKQEIISKLNSVLGMSKGDTQVPKVTATFMELIKLADFRSAEPLKAEEKIEEKEKSPSPANKLGISYTINLNLPATADVEVFNAIFKSLKENLLK